MKEPLGDVAGAMFEQILIVERTAEELEELEEKSSDPSDWALRLGQLKRHKRMLDLLSQGSHMIDLTIRDGDDEEERQTIIDCQNTLRGVCKRKEKSIEKASNGETGEPIRCIRTASYMASKVEGNEKFNKSPPQEHK